MGHDEIKELFFENPSSEFYLRQIARLTKTPKTTASAILNNLTREKIILKVKSEPFDRYIANTGMSSYKFYKKQFILEKIHKSGLIGYLAEQAHPKSIVLFGSSAKGEYNSESDIDIFLEAPEKKLDLNQFQLNHKVSLFFAPSIRKISEELRNNVINGIVLHGIIRL